MGPLTEVEIAQRLDPELTVGVAGTLPPHLPAGELTVDLVREIDRGLAVIAEASGSSEWIPRPDGSQLELRRHLPTTLDSSISRSVILWIHGGGMFLGSARQDDANAQALSDALGIRIASVDYRLAPEHPYPEPLDDCYTALAWLAERYDRVVVVGASAGGGLAAGLTLLARDRSRPAIAGLLLAYPMLDDRETAGARQLANTVVWNARLNRLGWDAYLGAGSADEYAVPARAVDLTGFPPTYLDTGDLDLFFDEDSAFAEKLRAAGVPLDFVVEHGAVHGFDLIAPEAQVSRRTIRRRRDWLARILRAEAAA
ncbi:MAG TPA: alpha/beta hydrolase [Galbitalea sp.]|jgi:acetyl esterase/lipase|nr:alpha/beta hydrolase [Galbitalea sp.]